MRLPLEFVLCSDQLLYDRTGYKKHVFECGNYPVPSRLPCLPAPFYPLNTIVKEAIQLTTSVPIRHDESNLSQTYGFVGARKYGIDADVLRGAAYPPPRHASTYRAFPASESLKISALVREQTARLGRL